MRLFDADAICLPNDLPYKGSVKRILIQAPTVDAVPVVHGRWESVHKYNDGEKAVGTCSVCKVTGELRTKRDEWGCWNIDSLYCPACGAKMDLEGTC